LAAPRAAGGGAQLAEIAECPPGFAVARRVLDRPVISPLHLEASLRRLVAASLLALLFVPDGAEAASYAGGPGGAYNTQVIRPRTSSRSLRDRTAKKLIARAIIDRHGKLGGRLRISISPMLRDGRQAFTASAISPVSGRVIAGTPMLRGRIHVGMEPGSPSSVARVELQP